jgi:ApaG protein
VAALGDAGATVQREPSPQVPTTSSTATTSGIQVDVLCRYLPDQSDPPAGEWFFVYQITIHNHSERTVQLISRQWHITNAHGRVEIVRGPGVVGHQPTLRPQEGFQYTSGCPLDTPFGTMQGQYHMVTDDGTQFDVEVAEFTLVEPGAVH